MEFNSVTSKTENNIFPVGLQEEVGKGRRRRDKVQSQNWWQGFTQREGIDYTEIFSPIVKHTSIRILLTIVACYNLELEQIMNVNTTFLHGNLEETIFMRQLEGYEVKQSSELVC